MDQFRRNNIDKDCRSVGASRTERACPPAHCNAAEGKAQDTRAAARRLDQFYTRKHVAELLFSVFCKYFDPSRFLCIEPSAGTGSISGLLPRGSIAYDIDPRASGIIKADFLKIELPAGRRIAVIGNPPFGKNSSMAVKFFNHAARGAAVIAFILPKTFQKASIQRRLDPFFHLLHETAVPDDAFLFQGERKNVPAVIQIWVRRSVPREQVRLPIVHEDFEFTQGPWADFVIQRVGSNAGRVHSDRRASASSHYFIKANVEGVETIMRSLDLQVVARRTAGNPSLAKTELVAWYSQYKMALNLFSFCILCSMKDPTG